MEQLNIISVIIHRYYTKFLHLQENVKLNKVLGILGNIFEKNLQYHVRTRNIGLSENRGYKGKFGQQSIIL